MVALPQANVRRTGDFPDSEFVTIPNVPIFAEHVTTSRPSKRHPQGRTLQFGLPELQKLAYRCNRRINESGDYAGIVVGHTPAPEAVRSGTAKMPELVGYAGPFRIGLIGEPGERQRYAILADFHVYRDDVAKLRKFPRRSPELWLEDSYDEMFLDPIALLGAEAPRLDLGLLYSAAHDDGRLVEKYACAAPSATSVSVPSDDILGGKKQYSAAKPPGAMPMLAQEDVQQIVDAMEQLDWVQWCKQQMQADGGGMGSMPGGDALPAPPPDVGGPDAAGAPPAPPMGGPPAPPAAPPAGPPPGAGGPPGGDDPEKKKMAAGGAMGGSPGPKMNYGAGENSAKPAAGNVDPEQTKPSTNNSVDGMTGGDAASSYPGGEKGKEISVEKFSKLEERLAAAERRAVNADRKAALTEYRMQYAFDLDAEVQRCDYSKMSEANFADHLTAIEQNYRPIMAEQDVFVPDHVPAVPGARRHVETAEGPGRAHYSKDVSDEARIICEDAAIAGRTVDYSAVLEEVARKRGLARA